MDKISLYLFWKSLDLDVVRMHFVTILPVQSWKCFPHVRRHEMWHFAAKLYGVNSKFRVNLQKAHASQSFFLYDIISPDETTSYLWNQRDGWEKNAKCCKGLLTFPSIPFSRGQQNDILRRVALGMRMHQQREQPHSQGLLRFQDGGRKIARSRYG